MTIRLTKHAPWERKLFRRFRTWFAQVDGRHFRITAEGSYGWWNVEEITADGDYVQWIAVCVRNLPGAKQAIADAVADLSFEEIQRRVFDAPPAGTGRNHAKNVEHRRAWREGKY